MSEAKNLKNGDLINVNHGGESFKAKFIRYSENMNSMQVFARGKMTFYPIATFDGMIDASKTAEEIISESKAKLEKKEVKEVKKVKEAEPKKDLVVEAEKDMKTKEKEKPAIKAEKKLAAAPKVKAPKAEKKEKAPKAEKAPAVDRAELIKKLKKGEQNPLQIMKESGASKTSMIAAMLLLDVPADEIKKNLKLTITQFVYNIRAKLYASGELKKV